MRKTTLTLAVLGAILMLGIPLAMAGNGSGPGDGTGNLYKYERDTDGDGIPNCQDADWVRPLDGSGYGKMGDNSGPGEKSGDSAKKMTRSRKGADNSTGNRSGILQHKRDRSCLE